MPPSTALLKDTRGEKNCNSRSDSTTRVSWYWIRNVRDRQYPSGLFPLHSSSEKGFLSPGISGIKPREEWNVCMPGCSNALDIPISWYRGVFLLATSSPPLRDIHPLHGIYYPLSTCALCTPGPSFPATRKTLGNHLTEDSAVSMVAVFPRDFLDGNPNPAQGF